MVQILPEVPSFGQSMSRSFGTGLNSGLDKSLDFYAQMKVDKYKADKRKELFNEIEGSGNKFSQGSAQDKLMKSQKSQGFTNKMAQEFTDGLQEIENAIGKELTPEEIGPLWKKFTESQANQEKQQQSQNNLSAEQVRKQEMRALIEDQNELARSYRSKAESLERREIADRKYELENKKFEHSKDQATQSAIDKSYESVKPYIDEVTSAQESFETEMKPRLMQMQKLNDDELIGPTAAKFLENLGIPLGMLENPSNELYQKLSQDLLKGLPDTYGNRILKVEVENFLRTIPQIINSPDGRRMIASNMLKLGEIKEIYYNEMRKQQMNYLDENKKFPKDFQQRIYDNIRPQLDRLNQQFVKMSEIKSVPEGTVPFFNPQGEISFVPDTAEDLEWAEKNGGQKIW